MGTMSRQVDNGRALMLLLVAAIAFTAAAGVAYLLGAGMLGAWIAGAVAFWGSFAVSLPWALRKPVPVREGR